MKNTAETHQHSVSQDTATNPTSLNSSSGASPNEQSPTAWKWSTNPVISEETPREKPTGIHLRSYISKKKKKKSVRLLYFIYLFC